MPENPPRITLHSCLKWIEMNADERLIFLSRFENEFCSSGLEQLKNACTQKGEEGGRILWEFDRHTDRCIGCKRGYNLLVYVSTDTCTPRAR
jgi:hypothetical protein